MLEWNGLRGQHTPHVVVPSFCKMEPYITQEISLGYLTEKKYSPFPGRKRSDDFYCGKVFFPIPIHSLKEATPKFTIVCVVYIE